MITFNHSKLIGFLILCTIILLANTNNPPNGRTGAPGDSTCASGCHSGTNSSLDGTISLAGLPTTIQASTTYTITVTVDNPNSAGVRGGFQWVALNSSNQNVGSMANPDINSNTIVTGGRTYHEHAPAQVFNGSNEANYTVEWTSPAGPNNETITFYGCGVISNGAGGNSGDRVTFTNTSGTLMASATPPSINVSILNNVTCFNGNDGSAVAMGSAGTPGYTYLWDNGENNATAINLNSGMHTVTVTDAASNTAEGSILISEPSQLIPAIVTSTNEDCTAQNGIAEITGTGGTPAYSYLWPDGTMNAINGGLAAGNYLATVTDAGLCSETIDVMIGNNASTVSINMLNMNAPDCAGNANGNITVSGFNGMSPYSYLWSDGSSNATITDLAAGIYMVTVTDNLGCTAAQSYTLSDPPAVTLNITGTNLNCFNDASGTAQAAAAGGSGSYMYMWSDGSTTGSISNLSAGIYLCTVSDLNGCQKIDSILISEPSILLTNLSSSSTVIGGSTGTATTTPSGGTSPYTQNWSTGSTNTTITNLGIGTYYITLTDNNNCTLIDSITVLDTNCNLTATHITNSISCNGSLDGSIDLSPTLGTGMLVYNWSSGQTTQDLNNLAAGLYSVTITDASLCTFEINNIEIREPDALSLTPEVVTLPGCNGTTLGIITVNVTGGTEPYAYQWDQGSISDTIYVDSGMYPVTITDANNCSENTIVNLILMDSTPPTLLVEDFTLYLDANGRTDSITSAMFDQGSFDDCQIDQFFFNNSTLDCSQNEVSLLIELQDVNGNSSFDSVLVTVLDTIKPEFICNSDLNLSSCGPSSYTLPIATDNCGTVNVTQISGPTIQEDLQIGTHIVVYEAIDQFDNTSQCSFNITVDPEIEYTVITTDVTCFNFQDGTFSLGNVSGLNSPFTFTIASNPQFLEAGDYMFTITDGSGCEIIDSFEISEPPILFISDFDISNSTNSNSMDGSIAISPEGGVPGYTYEWFLNGILVSNDQNINNLAPGIYTCVVTDASGCTYESIEFEVEAITTTLEMDLDNAIEIYPNPVNNILFISQNKPNREISSYRLMDMDGKMIRKISQPKSNESIDVNSYKSGLYLLEIISEDSRLFKKILIL